LEKVRKETVVGFAATSPIIKFKIIGFRMMKSIVYLAFMFLSLGNTLQAQVSFRTRVSKTAMSTDERLRVNFEISSNNGQINQRNFTPPTFTGFQKIMGPSTSQEYSYINGKVSSKFVYGYILQPNKTGKLKIGQASVKIDGKTYKTQPVTITVTKGQNANRQNTGVPISRGPKNNNITVKDKIDNAILVAELTKTNPYVNEAVGLVYKLYIPRNYGVFNYNETAQPQFNGFWVQDVDKNISGPFEGQINGKPYRYYILRKKLLFPQQAGKLTVKALTLQIDLKVPVYRNFFGMRVPDYEVQRVKLTSGKKVLRVKELPKDGQPIDFSGAVGKFDLKTTVDKNQVKTGEPVNVSVQVQGTGNLKLFDLPKLKASEGLEIYDPKHTEHIKTTFAGNRGMVKDDYVLVPGNPGKYIIPGMRFVYFDPKSGKYITKNSEDIVLFITGEGKQSNPNNLTQNNNNDSSGQNAVDFRFIKDKINFISKNQKDFYAGKLFYTLIGLAFLLAFIAFGYHKYLSNKVYDVAYEQQKKNKNLATKFLKEAKKSIGDKETFYARLEKALHNFLKARLQIDTTEMTRQNIQNKLLENGVNQDKINQLTDLLNRCDMARYAPTTTTKMEQDFADAEHLMNSF